MRTGLFVALGIGIHNFPEGMASFAGALESRDLGMAIAFAVAVHNIPEGLAVSAPIYAATGSRGKALLSVKSVVHVLLNLRESQCSGTTAVLNLAKRW